MPQHYRRFGEIKIRKIASRTKFLDKLLELLAQYMDEGMPGNPERLSQSNY